MVRPVERRTVLLSRFVYSIRRFFGLPCGQKDIVLNRYKKWSVGDLVDLP